ncbi:MAG: ATP-binding protein [Bacteroidales bacterium]|jgi:hypothetical protein|nr:ATP-binding protein [Bacteroidales bacterium]
MDANLNSPKILIDKITFNDGQTLRFDDSGIFVFTGANNCGKSQLLRDIGNNFLTSINKKIVVRSIDSLLIGDIDKELSACKLQGDTYFFDGDPIVDPKIVKSLWNQKNPHPIAKHFICYLSTEHRLSLSGSVPTYDIVGASPCNPLQRLLTDEDKEKYISNLFHIAFALNLWINRIGQEIHLFVGEKPKPSEGEQEYSKSYLSKLLDEPTLDKEGDGMRSFAGIILNTFISDYSITIIDEPEAFLHPPQARLLGEILAKNKKPNSQLFISTHSEDFIKGLIDVENENVKVFRINRVNNINHINVLPQNVLKKISENPIMRYSNILSGLFHSKVILCEGDSDCKFYQAIFSSIKEEKAFNRDILFTYCGGKQRLKDIIPAFTALNVPTVVISDIDILDDDNVFKQITETLGIVYDRLAPHLAAIKNFVECQHPQLNTEETKKELNDKFDNIHSTNLSIEDIKGLKKILKKSSAWAEVKRIGKFFFSGQAYSAYKEIDSICSEKGLFIVPVGELESFCKSDSNHGPEWVINILESKDLAHDPELEDARKFVRDIALYLQK